jgi:hypothetical protein
VTAEQFAYWLQGYAELNDAAPSAEQWQAIRDHLSLVFQKVTPQRHWINQPFVSPPPQSPTSVPIDYDLRPRVTCSVTGTPTSALSIC